MIKYLGSIKKSLVSLIILLFFSSSYALDKPPENKPQNIVPAKLKELKSNPKWQNFIKQKELASVNYDLYRIIGDSSQKTSIMGGGSDPYGYIVDKHNETFCSLKKQTNGSTKCNVSALYELGDIRSSILLDQNIYTNQDQVLLVSEIINNIANPFPSSIFLDMANATENIRKLPRNQAAFAEALVQEARSGIAKHSFNNMTLNRLPIEVLEGSGVNDKNKSFSKLSLMEQEATNRFENSDWHTTIDNANQEVLLKEMVKMEAFKIWMEYHKYKQNERIEALLATMISTQSSLNQFLIEQKYLNAQNQ